jgi:hypothetical protein
VEAAARCWRDAEELEVVGGDGLAGDERGPLARRENPAHVGVAGQAGERRRAALDIEEVRIRRRELREVLAQAGVDLHPPIGVLDGGPAQQHGVDDGEERGVEADAER